MYTLYKELTDERVLLAYFGVFNDNITDLMIGLSEDSLKKQDELKKLSRRASFLIVESFQNVVRHSVEIKETVLETESRNDYFQISVLQDRIVISSVNVIKNSDADKLDEFIDRINALSDIELKELRKSTLLSSEISEKGGAGLGIIEMVRRSGLPLKKEFIPLKQGFSLIVLSLELTISKEEKQHKVPIEHIKNTYTNLAEQKVVMLYKGDFSSETVTGIIKMLNNNLMKNGETDARQVKNIVSIIEVLQNVSRYGKEIEGQKEGLFSLKTVEEEIFIECGNFIKQEDYPEFKVFLEYIKSLKPEAFKKYYREKLINSDKTEWPAAGLGLIEIAKFTQNAFTYKFTETPDGEIFFSITIKTA
jgi:hypothetical protein